MGRGNKAIFKDFYENSGFTFQIKCFEWLQFLFPDIRNAAALGEVDRNGIDLYTLKDDGNYSKAIQCKGFEKTFSQSQLNQCIKSISIFIQKNEKCDEYFLLINHEVNTEQHKLLSAEVKRIEKLKLAQKAIYLTPQTFVNYYNKQFQDYILTEINKSNERFFKNYNSIMEQKFYLENVPFFASSHQGKIFGPTSFLWQTCQNEIEDVTDKAHLSKIFSKMIFIISEFGFGKTSLLFNFFHFLLGKKYIPIFLPVSSFRSQTFDNTSNIAKEIFRTITQSDFDKKNKFLNFSAEAMGTLLIHNPQIVLMFDGLDEHTSLYNKDGLKTLFESTNDLVAPIIFSFRKSFWEERRGEFEFSRIKPNRKNIQLELFLSEWDDFTIEEYIQRFSEENQEIYSPTHLSQLDGLKALIKNKQYEVYYGDIPKRPLFLEMIIRDVLNGNIKRRNISELYAGYFREKFKRDLTGQIDGLSPKRYFPDMSIDAAELALVNVHIQLAKYCIRVQNINGIESANIENIVHENEMVSLATQYNLPQDIGKLLPLSVLVPISRRNASGMTLKYVHKSFMEFFVAKYLYTQFVNSDDNIAKLFTYTYPTSITNFFSAIVETENKENQLSFLRNSSYFNQFNGCQLGIILSKSIDY